MVGAIVVTWDGRRSRCRRQAPGALLLAKNSTRRLTALPIFRARRSSAPTHIATHSKKTSFKKLERRAAPGIILIMAAFCFAYMAVSSAAPGSLSKCPDALTYMQRNGWSMSSLMATSRGVSASRGSTTFSGHRDTGGGRRGELGRGLLEAAHDVFETSLPGRGDTARGDMGGEPGREMSEGTGAAAEASNAGAGAGAGATVAGTLAGARGRGDIGREDAGEAAGIPALGDGKPDAHV